MAYLTFTSSEERSSGFKFIGASTPSESIGLISSNTSLISNNTSLISSSPEGGLDTCSFYDGPSESTIVAFGESFESAGSATYYGGESCGSIAYSGGGESCGSIASSSSSSSFSGGCCYSC